MATRPIENWAAYKEKLKGFTNPTAGIMRPVFELCLLYTSDAADERSSVDLGGRRIIQKKTYANKTKHRNIQLNVNTITM